MQEEATDELVSRKSHRLDFARVTIVLVGEGDQAVGEIKDTRVRDSNTMSVASKIRDDRLGRREGFFRVDDPFFSFQQQKGVVKVVRIRKIRARRRES